MENASKALIIASSILLGIMIISVAVALFNSFGGSGSQIMSEVEKARIAEFNNQFLKYYGKTSYFNEETDQDEIKNIKVSAHDIVSLVNLAIKNNEEYEIQDQAGKSQSSNYIQIDVNKYKNFEKQEKRPNQYKDLTEFIKQNDMIQDSYGKLTKKYYYVSKIEINETTQKIIYMQIQDYK